MAVPRFEPALLDLLERILDELKGIRTALERAAAKPSGTKKK